MVETKQESATAPPSHLAEALRTARYALIDNRRLRYTILLGTLLGIASFFPVWLIQPYMRQAGVPLAWFGPVWTVANLTVALGALASHRTQYRLGDRKMVILFILLIGAGYFGLGIVGGLWGFLFYYLLTFMRGLRGPMLLDHLQAESPSANRASILSLQSVSFRIFFACTAPFVGKLADTVGVQQTFHLLLYAFLITLPLFSLLFLRHSHGDKGI
jgi:cyanate permease